MHALKIFFVAMQPSVLIVFIIPSLALAEFDVTKHPNYNLLDHETCGNSASDRIIGGREAALGEKPWLARVGYVKEGWTKPSYRCGGSILNKNTIITAAHCVTNIPLKVGSVMVGEHNTESNPDCNTQGVCAPSVQVFKPKEVIYHEKYNFKPFKNDIALIRLDKDIQFNAYVTPICFIRGSLLSKNFVDTKVEVAGWGITDIENPSSSKTLMTVQLKVQKLDNCVEHYRRHAPVGETQLCVGGEVGKDSCGGDSGGPLTQIAYEDGDSSPRAYMIGIVSFGSKRCGRSTMPGIYTRLSTYASWVLDNLKESKVQFKIA